MIKLFITLYIMVFASFGVFLLYVSSIDIIGESIGDGALIDEKISKGTFKLLNDSLIGLDKQQSKALITQYEKLFGREFGLIELSTLNLEKKQIKNIEKGKVVSTEENALDFYNGKLPKDQDEDDDFTILYSKRPDSSQVWRLNLDFDVDFSINDNGGSINISLGKFAEGMMFLIQTKLLKEKEEKWPDTLKELQLSFGLPLSLKQLNSFDKSPDEVKQHIPSIKKGKVMNISQGTKHATLVQKIPDSAQLLQIGPVEIPWYMRNFHYLILLAFILSFATTLFIWIWPLWSNLIRVKKAADDFGSGNYSARIPNKRWSPIANISKAFNAMAEQTQSSMRSQKELTTAISHELRTPIARMKFALEMLDASHDKKDKSLYVKDINEDIDELNLLLEELLTYARFDQKNHQLNPRLEKLIPWFSHSMEKLIPLAGKKTLHYKVEGIGVNETSLFEPRLMSRVLDNLVQNALRYSKQTVEITLSKDHHSYLLMVEDDGDGIATDKREHIFDAFSRIDASRDRASGGFGLGLAIVDRIIKAHDGSISIHSSMLGGARFEVRIPAKTVPA